MELANVENIHGLNDAEQRLIRGAAENQAVLLGPDDEIRAAVLCALAAREPFGAHPVWPVPAASIVLEGGKIIGEWSMMNRVIDVSITIESCKIRGAIYLDNAISRTIRFLNCEMTDVHFSYANIRGELQIHGCKTHTVRGLSANIEGTLVASQSTFEGDHEGVAFRIDQSRVHSVDFSESTLNGSLSMISLNATTFVGANGIKIKGDKGAFAIRAVGLTSKVVMMDNAEIEGVSNFYSAALELNFHATNARFSATRGDRYAIDFSSAKARTVTLDKSIIEGGMAVSDAVVDGGFSAVETQFKGEHNYSLNMQLCSVKSIDLHKAVLSTMCHLEQVEIEGSLKAQGTKFNAGGYWCALNLGRANIGHVQIGDATFEGQLYLLAVNVREGLSVDNVVFNNTDGTTIEARNSQTKWADFSKCKIKGTIDLGLCMIQSRLFISETTIETELHYSLGLNSAKLGSVWISECNIQGCCDLSFAAITDYLNIDGTTIRATYNWAIEAAGASIGNVFISPYRGSNYVKYNVIEGGLNFIRATIRHDLAVHESKVRALQTIALAGRGLQIGGSLKIEDKSQIDGAVAVPQAIVAGSLQIRNSFLWSATTARARVNDPLPPISIPAPDEDSKPWVDYALDVGETEVKRLVLPEKAEHRPRGKVRFSRAKVGTFVDYADSWPSPESETDFLELDGFEYEHLRNPNGRPDELEITHNVAHARILWLRTQPKSSLVKNFRPQPWQQLARVLTTQGYEDDARKVAIARRVALRYSEGTPRFQNAISRALHVLADYGFNPWKSVWWSLATIGIFAGIYYFAAHTCTSREPLCADQTAFVRVVAADFVPAIQDEVEAAKTLARVYPAFDPVLYSLDAFLPLLNLGTEPYWRPNENLRVDIAGASFPAGRLLQWLYVIEQILGAVLASLVVTGFTGLLTRDER